MPARRRSSSLWEPAADPAGDPVTSVPHSRPSAPAPLVTWPDAGQLADKLRSALPLLLFGFRLWAAVCLALYVAFSLELDNASWAGTTAAIVSQPSLGASLRKGSFRLIGTVLGAVVIVVLTACFPQSRVGFLVSLALWGMACGLMATILRNSTAYAAALAGYTAVIIASDMWGPTGGANGDVFMLAVTRASEICIGIVSAGIVTTVTDLGGARRRLAARFAGLAAETARGFATTFQLPGRDQETTRTVRRELAARAVALGPAIDEAIGEASSLRYRVGGLQAAVDGLFAALSCWRTVGACLERLPDAQGRRETGAVLESLPPEWHAATQNDPTVWMTDPSRLRRVFIHATRALAGLPAGTPSLRLLADATAAALIAFSRTLAGLALLKDGVYVGLWQRPAGPRVPDPLPAFINAARILLTFAAVELFWVLTAWPQGGLALTFAAIGVILLSPQDDRAYLGARAFLLGIGLAAALAGLVNFVLLPNTTTYLGLCLSLGLVLVPMGALSAQPWQAGIFVATIVNFMPLLGPANEMTYDPMQFYNTTLAAVGGMGAATIAMVLVPPLSPALRTRRLLTLTLRDLRGLAAGTTTRTIDDWEGRIYNRLTALPAMVELLQVARLAAALSVGTEIIHLRRLAGRLGLMPDVDAALDALAAGDSGGVIARLARIDQQLQRTGPDIGPGATARLRARGRILTISAALTQHGSYFDWQVSR
jgi:uncharacterized membrane protein YccC